MFDNYLKLKVRSFLLMKFNHLVCSYSSEPSKFGMEKLLPRDGLFWSHVEL